MYLLFGACELSVHDGGLEFCNELAKEINELLEIRGVTTTPYRPSGNGQIERVHGLLNKLLTTVIDRDQRNWDEWLPSVTFAFNTAKHEVTTFSPFYLMFAREAHIGIDLVTDVNVNVFEGPTADYVSLTKDRMRVAYALVQELMQLSFDKAKRRYDERVKSCQFEVGQRVWYFCPRRRRGLSGLWLPRVHIRSLRKLMTLIM